MTDVGRRRHTAFPEKREKGKKGRLVQSKLFITINNTVKTSYEQHIYILMSLDLIILLETSL